MRISDVPLSLLFEPRSIAVVGASGDPRKAGHQMMRSLSDFPGPLFAVNRGGTEVLGRPGFERLQDIPEPVDLAVLVLPPEASVHVLEDCAAAGIHAVVLCSGGFGESGEDGRELQRLAVEIAAEHRMWLLGPNTSGFANPRLRVCASFVPALGLVPAGNLAIVAQSGGVNHALAFLGANDRLGFSKLIGLGNSANLDFPDVLEYLQGDPDTAAVALHIEGLRDGRATAEAIQRLATQKPVVVYKVGRADVQAFAASHTGALTGDQRLATAALRQAGAVIVDDTTEAVDALKALALHRLSPGVGGVAVVTGQAGPGIIMADVLRSEGIEIPTLSAASLAKIAELLPPMTYTTNPVDTGRPGPSFAEVLRAVASDPAIAVIVVYQLVEPAVDLAGVVSTFARECGKPVLLASGGPAAEMEPMFAVLEQAGVACYESPERAAQAAAAVIRDAAHRPRRPERLGDSSPAVKVLAGMAKKARAERRRSLYEDEAKQLLAVAGIVAPPGTRLATRGDAHALAAWFGYPVVAKLLAPDLTHKSEAGAVKVGLRDEQQLDQALDELDAAAAQRGIQPAYLIERFLPGTELILGARRDASFGPTVLAGTGGVLAELLQDVAVRLAPIGIEEAVLMLDELRAKELLTGYRSPEPFDHRQAVARAIASLSQLISASPDVAEIDVNPLILRPDGMYAADALIVLSA